MDNQLYDALMLWFALLKNPPDRAGEDPSRIPDPVRAALIEKGFAHLHDGRVEITFEGIVELRRQA